MAALVFILRKCSGEGPLQEAGNTYSIVQLMWFQIWTFHDPGDFT